MFGLMFIKTLEVPIFDFTNLSVIYGRTVNTQVLLSTGTSLSLKLLPRYVMVRRSAFASYKCNAI